MGNHSAKHRQFAVAAEVLAQLSATCFGHLQSCLLRPPVIEEGNVAHRARQLSGMEGDSETVPLAQ